MKSFNELMAQCPKHDCAYVLYNKRWHRIEEHELRYICVLVANGDLPEDTMIKFSDGSIHNVGKNGRFPNISIPVQSNIFLLDSLLLRELNKIELKPNYKSEYGKK